MNSPLHNSLLAELADIERRQRDLALSPLDQQALDQAWEDVTSELNDLDTIYDWEWRDAREVIEEDGNWNDSQLDSPPPLSPIRFAPSPPPPISFAPGDPLFPPPVARTMSFAGVPPLSATREDGYPPNLRPFEEPPDPPAPFYPDDEEELAQWNNIVDDREGCMYCPGCHYCTGYGYDGADEI